MVDDVPVYLRQRERSLSALTSLIRAVTQAHPGHYLAAFPSFHYLNLAAEGRSVEEVVGLVDRPRGTGPVGGGARLRRVRVRSIVVTDSPARQSEVVVRVTLAEWSRAVFPLFAPVELVVCHLGFLRMS